MLGFASSLSILTACVALISFPAFRTRDRVSLNFLTVVLEGVQVVGYEFFPPRNGSMLPDRAIGRIWALPHDPQSARENESG